MSEPTPDPTQGLDAPAGADDPGALPIAETFVSIQGEGRLTGAPSWFVRVSGCNLRCGWCDTPYASWRPEGSRRTVQSLLAEARRSGMRHAVVTGGEPMLFRAVAELTRGLRCAGLHVTIETAGTLWLDAPADLMSISPKLSNSTPAVAPDGADAGPWRARHDQRRLDPTTLRRLLAAHPNRQLKFVVASESDVAEIDSLLEAIGGVAPEDVMLMPEGVTPAALAAKREFVAAACLRRGWRYCHRLHIDLFGNTRGT